MKPSNDVQAEFLSTYEQMADPLFRHAYFRVGDREKAVDIVQTTFAKAWQHVAAGRPVDNLKAFLYKIAHNLVVDSYRRPHVGSIEAMQEANEAFDVVDTKASSATVASAELRIVLEAIDRLPSRDRMIVTLRYVDGHSPQEIEEITGENVNVISVRLNRAVKKLRKMVDYDLDFIQSNER